MKKNLGFTLIELLVVITIIGIFLGFGIPQYNIFNAQVKLKNEAKKLVDVLELAKKKSLTGDLYDKNCSNFTGYQLSLTANNYSLIFCCNSGCSTPTTINTYTLSSNITNRTLGTQRFPPLMNGLNITIPSIQLKNSAINKCISITISPIGVIELADTLFDC